MTRLLPSLLILCTLLAGLAEASAAGGRYLVRAWQSEDGLPSNSVRSVAQSADGYLWIATAEGLVRFDGVRFSSEMWGQDYPPPRSVYALNSGEVWITTMRGGLWRWAAGVMKQVWAEQEEQDPRSIRSIAADEKRGVLIDSTDGLYFVTKEGLPVKQAESPKRQTAKEPIFQQGITQTIGKPLSLKDMRGRLWERTPTGGLAVTEPSGRSYTLPEFSEGIQVTTITEDREGTLWVATNGSGLFHIRERRIEVMDTADGISDLKIRAILEDSASGLWAANRSGGVDFIQQGGVQSFTLGEDEKTARLVTSICTDSQGTLWFARENGGVYRHTKNGFEEMTQDKPWVRKAATIIADSQDRLWVGGADELAAWKDGILQHYGIEQGLPAHSISTLATARERLLWVGMARGSFYQWNGERFTQAGDSGGASISSLMVEEQDSLWLTTLGSGLLLYRNGTLTRFDSAEGLPESRLTCILEDETHHLWLGSLAGIFRVAKSELFEIAEGQRTQAHWLHLDRADGMISRECTGGFQPAGWRCRDGTLRFPTVHGIASLQPKEIHLNRVPPLVHIETTRANGKAVYAQENALQIGPGRSRIEFRYTALSLAAPEKVRFRTRLVGLQDGWQDTGTQRQVTYEAVPPGNYIFRVLAANNDGLWSESGAELKLSILPHYWETLWFRTLAALVTISIAFGIGVLIARARARMKLLRLRAETARVVERARIAQDLHDDLGASLTEISLLAGLAAEETDELKRQQVIPTIATKTQHLVSTLDEIVWAVNPRHDTLASFVDYLTASAAELVEAAGILLRIEIAESLSDKVVLDSVQRHALYLASREALNNAVKHSEATEIHLAMAFPAGVLHISIRDNGKGFSPQEISLSEGLLNMRARLSALGGDCQFHSSHSGTEVAFSLKLSQRMV